MNRFFVSKDSFNGNKVLLGKDRAHQIRSVLRMSALTKMSLLAGPQNLYPHRVAYNFNSL